MEGEWKDRDCALPDLRRQIDSIDEEMLGLLEKRMSCASKIGKVKRKEGIPLFDPGREEEVLNAVSEAVSCSILKPEVAEEVFRLIVNACRIIQENLPETHVTQEGSEECLLHGGYAWLEV